MRRAKRQTRHIAPQVSIGPLNPLNPLNPLSPLSLLRLLSLLILFGIVGCGGDSPTTTTPPPPPPPPAATIQVSGDGDIAVGPSIDPTFCCSTLFPITIMETSGGTAIWNFFRVSYFLNGVEVERSEVGSDIIRDQGVRNIAPNSTTPVDVTVRANVLNFDAVDIILGFSDTRDGRAFESALDLTSFDNVVINPVPTIIPGGGIAAIVETSRD